MLGPWPQEALAVRMFNHHLTWLLVLINGSGEGKRWLVINLQSDGDNRTQSPPS